MVVFAGMYPYTTPNWFELGDQVTSWIGPSLSVLDVSLLHILESSSLTKLDPCVEAAIGAEDVHIRFTVVAFVTLVDICGS